MRRTPSVPGWITPMKPIYLAIFASILLAGLALLVSLGGQRAGAGVPPSLLDSATGKIVRQVLDDTENGQRTSFVILLTDQADVSKAYGMRDEDARGWYVYNTLKSHAEKTQASLRSYLAGRGIPYQSFWVANMLVVTGDRSLVETVAARSDVRVIESNRPSKWIEDDKIANFSDAPVSPLVVEWGVQRVNAPQVWALGHTGTGIVIANQDTGVRWSHNGLRPHYRGWNGAVADHNFNWWDAIHSGGGSCGANSQVPCDDQGHGTHTTGTTSGDDGGTNQVGVAPGAKWIGCRNMNVGNGTPATYTECFQFFLAPTDLAGQNANPALRPHVMNNSWGCPPSEGCAANSLQSIVENTQAAGIFVEASAGNSGPGCSTVTDPPAIYAASFSTGAIDINNALASFSSRGPVLVDGSNRMKPEIAAPGSNVRSTTRTSDTSYGNMSGTSMAGPHVVGVVALLWSAHPQLSRMITETKQILQNTANPNVTVSNGALCGGTPIPNNHFGYGRIDALAAVNSVGGGTPTATSVPPTSTRTNTPIASTSTPTITATPTCGVSNNYNMSRTTGNPLVPATNLVPGSVCNGCVVNITLPFAYTLYDVPFTTANVSPKGTLQFLSAYGPGNNTCLPATNLNYAIATLWDDLQSGPVPFMGVYTQVIGTAPNRTFIVEWKAPNASSPTSPDWELLLYEGQSRFEIIFRSPPGQGGSATIGVQEGIGTGLRTATWSCNTTGLQSGDKLIFNRNSCPGILRR